MNKISARQLCLFFSCMAPVGKMIRLPSILSEQAGNGLLLSALFSASLQLVVLFALLKLSERTNLSFFELVENTFGKVGKGIFSALFALYFVWAAIYPLLEQKSFVQSAFYDTIPAIIVFLPFFLFSAFACMKNLTAIGRSADLSAPVFLVSYFALLALSIPAGDIAALLPFREISLSKTALSSLHTLNWFSDSAYLLLFLGHFEGNKKTTAKVMIGYAVGTIFVLLFLAVFFGIFQSIAGRQNFAVTKIGKYHRAIGTLGRVDFLFAYALSIVLIFYSVIPLLLSVESLTHLFGEHRLALSLAVNGVALLMVFLFNYRSELLYSVVNEKLFFLFLLFADIIPLCTLFFRRKSRA